MFLALMTSTGYQLLYPGSEEELFLRANKCYEQDCEQALALYQSMQHKGQAVWYNMGNCFYRLGDYPQACFCWKKAERGATHREFCDIARNQSELAHTLGKSVTNNWWYPLYWFICSCVSGASLFALQMFFLLCWYLLFTIGRYSKKMLMVFMVSVLMMIGLGLGVKYKEISDCVAIVVKPTSVFAGPDTNYHALAQLDAADQVVVQEEKDGWYKIKHPAGMGWIVAEAVLVA